MLNKQIHAVWRSRSTLWRWNSDFDGRGDATRLPSSQERERSSCTSRSRHVHRNEMMNKYYFSCQRERLHSSGTFGIGRHTLHDLAPRFSFDRTFRAWPATLVSALNSGLNRDLFLAAVPLSRPGRPYILMRYRMITPLRRKLFTVCARHAAVLNDKHFSHRSLKRESFKPR